MLIFTIFSSAFHFQIAWVYDDRHHMHIAKIREKRVLAVYKSSLLCASIIEIETRMTSVLLHTEQMKLNILYAALAMYGTTVLPSEFATCDIHV